MNRLAIYGAVAALVIVALVAVLIIGGRDAGLPAPGGSIASGIVAQQSNSSGVLFSAQQYSNYAYLIAPGNMSQQAKSALDGYTMSARPLSNGSENVTLGVAGTSRQGSLVLTPGEKLYVIETSFGDDGPGYDGSFGDDGFVLVNQSGYGVNAFGI
jgi:hypothetical protein